MSINSMLPIISDVAYPEPRLGELSFLLDNPVGILIIVLCAIVIIGMIVLIKIMIDRQEHAMKNMQDMPQNAFGSSPSNVEKNEEKQEYQSDDEIIK